MPKTWSDEKDGRKRRRYSEGDPEDVPCKSHKKSKHDKPTSSVLLTPPISDEDVDQSPTESKAKDEDDAVKGNFKNFSICKASRKVLRSKGVKYLFPIQYKTFDHIYEGKDVIGQARTGTGKTLSFVLPLLERLLSHGTLPIARGRVPIILVMAPTRELANQVSKEFSDLSQELHVSCIYGGTPYGPQERAIRQGIDVLVGTPGRILDHMGRGNLDLTKLQCVVLDEADQMLEIGFADTIEAASFNESTDKPQMLLFSATVPPWVSDTAAKYMNKDRIEVDLVSRNTVRTAVTVEHKALCCQYGERPSTICDVIQVYSGTHGRSIVFTSTKAEANELALTSALSQQFQVLHGDIQQSQCERTLQGFQDGKFPVLVATLRCGGQGSGHT